MFFERVTPLFAGVFTAVWFAAGFWGVGHADASVVIGATRVIYAAPAREATIKLTNEGSAPALIQAWIDVGDMQTAPAAISAPFLVTPPIARIDPGKAQTLRLFYIGDPLPTNRESVFYFNVLEIPPKPDSAQAPQNLMQLAFRSRIKLFFRPEGLPGSAAEAPAQIHWRLLRSASGELTLEANNPTAYHVSFTTLRVTHGADTIGGAADDGGMVAPGETHRFTLRGKVPATGPLTVSYHALNDYGGEVRGDSVVSP
ncbi:putative fimbrial chaperone YadV [Paraburkholderia aspalathi]|uniref:fimbrial biogenesis chaperone n=1 Tax=Paraburkholderia aspalathi TaxID=1324617 RepID=UPI00190CE185|nr:fimbria/pilus periplasmic chaperone [Paraburkholderia aspalathi]MBK3844327.1 fimbria/pilus periplasmic chaperone [Paraburkholderia aspalathi]CAE6871099.1 putative fimbrial chaperone YadV [Paraburkholderia aspalathi]CAE6872739.1 putative fimbrial chaperone YadV [Paraburkholderia aspalathi]